MHYTEAILLGLIAGAAVMPVSAASPVYVITADQVASTIGKTGVPTAPRQISMLSEVVATSSSPLLTVRSIQPMGNRNMLLRLECKSGDQCLPFYVILRVDEAAGALPLSLQAHASPAVLIPPPSPSTTQFVIRAGSMAMLQLDSERVHITIPVVCLENGAVGQTVHVRSRDRHRIYTARVIDVAMLKARL